MSRKISDDPMRIDGEPKKGDAAKQVDNEPIHRYPHSWAAAFPGVTEGFRSGKAY
jgi:hypothetical protein